MRTEALHNRHVPDGTYSMRRIGGRLVLDASKMDYSAVAELLNKSSDSEDCSKASHSEVDSAAKRKTTPNHNEASESREVNDDNHHHRTKPAKRQRIENREVHDDNHHPRTEPATPQRSENQEVDGHIDPLMEKGPHTILRNCSIVIG